VSCRASFQIPLERHKRICRGLVRTLSQPPRHVEMAESPKLYDLCLRLSPFVFANRDFRDLCRGSFGVSRRNGIWAYRAAEFLGDAVPACNAKLFDALGSKSHHTNALPTSPPA